jgi:hypothetical protein
MLKKSLGAVLLALMMGATPSMAWAECIRTIYNNSAYAYRITYFIASADEGNLTCSGERKDQWIRGGVLYGTYVPGFGNPYSVLVPAGQVMSYGRDIPSNSALSTCMTHVRIETDYNERFVGPAPAAYISGWAISYSFFDFVTCHYIVHDGSTAAHNLVLNDPADGDIIILAH